MVYDYINTFLANIRTTSEQDTQMKKYLDKRYHSRDLEMCFPHLDWEEHPANAHQESILTQAHDYILCGAIDSAQQVLTQLKSPHRNYLVSLCDRFAAEDEELFNPDRESSSWASVVAQTLLASFGERIEKVRKLKEYQLLLAGEQPSVESQEQKTFEIEITADSHLQATKLDPLTRTRILKHAASAMIDSTPYQFVGDLAKPHQLTCIRDTRDRTPCLLSLILCFTDSVQLEKLLSNIQALDLPHTELIIAVNFELQEKDQLSIYNLSMPYALFRGDEEASVIGMRNAVASASNGNSLMFIPESSRCIIDGMQELINVIERQPQKVLYFPHLEHLTSTGLPIKTELIVTPPRLAEALLLDNQMLPAGTVIFPKKIFKLIGGYREQFAECADYDLHVRIMCRYKAIQGQSPCLLLTRDKRKNTTDDNLLDRFCYTMAVHKVFMQVVAQENQQEVAIKQAMTCYTYLLNAHNAGYSKSEIQSLVFTWWQTLETHQLHDVIVLEKLVLESGHTSLKPLADMLIRENRSLNIEQENYSNQDNKGHLRPQEHDHHTNNGITQLQ